jgi:sulfatase maturation enzyme AslB (radical SAM superfamily)
MLVESMEIRQLYQTKLTLLTWILSEYSIRIIWMMKSILKQLTRKTCSRQYISLHASSQCNLKCKYCFMQVRHDVNITIYEAKRFIDFFNNELFV